MSVSRFIVHTLMTSLVHQQKLSKHNGNSIDPMDCYFNMLGTGMCLNSFNLESKEFWQFCFQCKGFIFFFFSSLKSKSKLYILSLPRLVDYLFEQLCSHFDFLHFVLRTFFFFFSLFVVGNQTRKFIAVFHINDKKSYSYSNTTLNSEDQL